MFDKLEAVVNRYEQIGEELTHPEVVSNNELFRKLMKEHSELTPIVEKYMKEHNITDDSMLPDFFVTAQTLNYKDRIAMQSIWQKHIDASISSTVNVPQEFPIEEVKDIYMEAWKAGLKGITMFR